MQRFQDLIKCLGLTNSEMAEMLGLTPSAVSDIIHGRVKSLSGPVMKLLEFKFNVNSNWLITGEGEMFLTQKPNDSEMRHSDNASMTDLMNDPQVQRLIVLLSGQREQVSVLNAYLSGTATIKELVATIEKLPEKKRIVALKQIQVLAEC